MGGQKPTNQLTTRPWKMLVEKDHPASNIGALNGQPIFRGLAELAVKLWGVYWSQYPTKIFQSHEKHGVKIVELGGGFKHFIFSLLPAEMMEDFHFDLYFSNGLKSPTSWGVAPVDFEREDNKRSPRLKPAEGLNQAWNHSFSPWGFWVGFPLARGPELGGSFWGFKQLFNDGLMRSMFWKDELSLSLNILYIYIYHSKKTQTTFYTW